MREKLERREWGTWGGTLFTLTTRDNTHDSCEKMAGKFHIVKVKMADRGNLEESEDEEIQHILDARHAKKHTKGNKKCSQNIFGRGDVQGLTSKEMLDKSVAKFFYFFWGLFFGIIYHS